MAAILQTTSLISLSWMTTIAFLIEMSPQFVPETIIDNKLELV